MQLATPVAAMGDQAALSLVPWPKHVEQAAGQVALSTRSRIVAEDAALLPLAEVLSDEIHTITGTRLRAGQGRANPADIILTLDEALGDEAYVLQVTDRATVRGGSYRAVAWGTATLLQAMDRSGRTPVLPRVTIRDEPDSPFRALLVDPGRQFHTIENLEQIVQLCRLYKINYLHLHLTDDQLFMFPSTAFPDAGKSNQELTRFAPPSAPAPIRPYTLEQLHHLERYSQARGVTIIPEIDLPGHSGRLTRDVPEYFLATPRNHTTINFASEKTIEAAATLLNELMDVFQATPYIHLGGDEVWMGHLAELPDFQEAIRNDPNANSVHDLYRRFVYRMNEVIKARGRQMIVWEEAYNRNVDHPYALPRDVIVFVWCLHNSPQAMLDDGYKIINGTWTPLYLVRDNKRSTEFIYNWHREQFGHERFTDWVTIEPTDRQIGAQMLAWEQSECFEIQSLRHRLPAMGERIWHADAGRTFEDFMQRIEKTDVILEKLVHPVSIIAEGDFIKDEHSFDEPITITLKSDRRDVQIRYTLDNSPPTAESTLYTGPFQVDRDVFLRAAQFDRQGRRQGYMSGAWFRRVTRFQENLATNKPVTATNTEHNADPRVAVDGNTDRDRHWAGGTPSSLTVDMEAVFSINRITLLTYYDGGRYYQYRIEVSTDGENWRVVDDASDNTAVAGPSGYQSNFPATEARYVRVHLLKNSANPGTHIVELMVFEAK